MPVRCNACQGWVEMAQWDRHRFACRPHRQSDMGILIRCERCQKWVGSSIFERHKKDCKTKSVASEVIDSVARSVQTFHRCRICLALFPEYSQLFEHSCAVVRQKKPVGKHEVELCGLCLTPTAKFGDIVGHMHSHKGEIFSEKAYPALIRTNGRRSAADDEWLCDLCNQTFKNAWDREEHKCPADATDVLKEVSEKLDIAGKKPKKSKVAKQIEKDLKRSLDTASKVVKGGPMTQQFKPDDKVQCRVCGNTMPYKTYEGHACMDKVKDRTKVAVFVSPWRKETTSLKVAATEFGATAIFMLRGVSTERPLEEVAKQCGSTILLVGSSHFKDSKERDFGMMEKSDIILMFPDRTKSPDGNRLVKTKWGEGKDATPVLIYPDASLFNGQKKEEEKKAPAVTEGQTP